jgi:hypothetical protein
MKLKGKRVTINIIGNITTYQASLTLRMSPMLHQPVPYRAARDPEGAEYFSREAGARSAIEHWLVQSPMRRAISLAMQ